MSDNKIKMTNQRLVILKFLETNYTHPNVDEIYNYVKLKLPQISKKTVYRNLEFLSNNKVINQVLVEGIKRYEPKLKEHHHLVCRNCGKIVDIFSDKLLSISNEFSKEIKDFKVDFLTINFYGICNDCKKKEVK